MSSLMIEVCKIESIEQHPNADRLAIATIKGWKTIIRYEPETKTSQFNVGDKCVFFPPDSVISADLSDKFGVTKYLQPLKLGGFRIRAARLRGIPSYGLVVAPDSQEWQVGDDMAEYYGVSKYQPPEPRVSGDTAPPHPAFHEYTDIENWANFPDAIWLEEQICITEKIHGTNCRLGYIRTDSPDSHNGFEFMAGSHHENRKELDAKSRMSLYWKPFELYPQIKLMLSNVSNNATNVILFGEIYGPGVQSMHYGLMPNQLGFAAFDISVDGVYLDFRKKYDICERYNIPFVPICSFQAYSHKIIEDMVDGISHLVAKNPEAAKAGGWPGREGIVITPLKERFSDTLSGRAILKAISADYLSRKE